MNSFNLETVKTDYSVSLVTARLESGLSIVEWCERNDVTVSSYQYHARKLRRIGLYPSNFEPTKSNGTTASKSDKKSSVTFAELLRPACGSGTTSQPGIPEVTVEYGNFRILVSGNANKETLEKVMEVVAHVG